MHLPSARAHSVEVDEVDPPELAELHPTVIDWNRLRAADQGRTDVGVRVKAPDGLLAQVLHGVLEMELARMQILPFVPAGRHDQLQAVEHVLEEVLRAVDQPVVRLLLDDHAAGRVGGCLLYTSPSPRDGLLSRMPSSA